MKRATILTVAIVTLVALLGVGTPRVHASASVVFSVADQAYFADVSGSWLLDSSSVFMGSFTTDNATLSNLVVGGTIPLVNYATLLSYFVPLNVDPVNLIGDGTTYSPSDANSGAMLQTYYGSNTSFASSPIYVMAFNATATNFISTLQVGVFQLGTNYPANMITGNMAVDLSGAIPIIGTQVTGILGSSNPYNWNDGNFWDPIEQFRLLSIPEPSACVLVGMGLLGTLLLRRRRR